jgi:hypothetical protein
MLMVVPFGKALESEVKGMKLLLVSLCVKKWIRGCYDSIKDFR